MQIRNLMRFIEASCDASLNLAVENIEECTLILPMNHTVKSETTDYKPRESNLSPSVGIALRQRHMVIQ